MAFCRFCGKELQEGEVCSCQSDKAQAQDSVAQNVNPTPAADTAAQDTNPAPAADTAAQDTNPAPTADTAAQNTNPAPTVDTAAQTAPVQPAPAPAGNTSQAQPSVTITLPNKDEVTDGLKKIFSITLGVLKKPATEGKAFVEKGNKVAAIGIIVVQALLSCIFSVILTSRLNLAIGLSGEYKFSGVKAFFLTLLFSLIFSAIMMLLLWGASILMKSATNLEQMLSLTAVRSIGLLPMIILGIVFIIINTPTTISLGLVLYYGAFLLGTIYLLGAVKGLTGVQDDKAAYVVFAVMVVFIFLFWLIGTKMALSLYLPSSIRDKIDNIGSLMRMF